MPETLRNRRVPGLDGLASEGAQDEPGAGN